MISLVFVSMWGHPSALHRTSFVDEKFYAAREKKKRCKVIHKGKEVAFSGIIRRQEE